jgi:hypothetical protein
LFTSKDRIRENLRTEIQDRHKEGYDTRALETELDEVSDSYDELYRFAERLANLPYRDDWPYEEPDDWASVMNASASDRATGAVSSISADEASSLAQTAFKSSVCGCVLGKPVEVGASFADLQQAAERAGEWPIRDYLSERVLDELGTRHPSWDETVRERIQHVAPDDDMNYTIMGMLVLEQYGLEFRQTDLATLWLLNLAPWWTFGPERTFLSKAAVDTVGWPPKGLRFDESNIANWAHVAHFGAELCGAAIRADAYGYAAPGKPALAAELAHRDASMTHRKTGIYGTMFLAASISMAFVADRPLDIFSEALKHVPQRSRFYEVVSDCLNIVDQAEDWINGYELIHQRHSDYGFCEINQEVGTVINTLKFADSVGDGICKQVSQGNDTDSFGASAGSILGAYFGPSHLDERWLAPFQNRIHTTLASFHEQDLEAVAKRMGELPKLT